MIERSRGTFLDESFFEVGQHDYQEIKEKARIPTMHGVAGKVLDVLQGRIGGQSLNIEDVASDMKLSKRTLQRRLQQQMINFANLRDVVRF